MGLWAKASMTMAGGVFPGGVEVDGGGEDGGEDGAVCCGCCEGAGLGLLQAVGRRAARRRRIADF